MIFNELEILSEEEIVDSNPQIYISWIKSLPSEEKCLEITGYLDMYTHNTDSINEYLRYTQNISLNNELPLSVEGYVFSSGLWEETADEINYKDLKAKCLLIAFYEMCNVIIINRSNISVINSERGIIVEAFNPRISGNIIYAKLKKIYKKSVEGMSTKEKINFQKTLCSSPLKSAIPKEFKNLKNRKYKYMALGISLFFSNVSPVENIYDGDFAILFSVVSLFIILSMLPTPITRVMSFCLPVIIVIIALVIIFLLLSLLSIAAVRTTVIVALVIIFLFLFLFSLK